MADEDRIEKEEPDTEAHQLGGQAGYGQADKGHSDPEDRDEPDVEGHQLGQQAGYGQADV